MSYVLKQNDRSGSKRKEKNLKEAQRDLVWLRSPRPAMHSATITSAQEEKVQLQGPERTPCPSHHCADAAVLGLGAAGSLGGWWRRAVVVGRAVSGVGGGVRWVAPVPMGPVRMSRVRLLLAVRRGRVVLVRWVLQVGRRVVVVMVVIRGWVLGHVAELGVVRVHGHWSFRLHAGCVVQVGWVRGVGDESRVQLGLRGGAGRLHTPGAEQRSEQRGRVGQGLGAVTGWAVSAGGGSPPHVRTANDGALHLRDRVGSC